MKGEYISKDYFDSAIQSIKQDTKSQVNSLKQDFKDQLDSFRMAVNARFDGVEGRLELLEDDMSKVKDVVISTDASLHNLVTELEHRDISVDRTKVFTV